MFLYRNTQICWVYVVVYISVIILLSDWEGVLMIIHIATETKGAFIQTILCVNARHDSHICLSIHKIL